MSKQMKWMVYLEDWNRKEIKEFNIFDHTRFEEDVKKLKKKKLPKEEFAEQLRKDLMYYFWAKCEYEIILTSFPTYIVKEEAKRISEEYEKKKDNSFFRTGVDFEIGEKIDIYDQVMLNFDIFADYVWDFGRKNDIHRK